MCRRTSKKVLQLILKKSKLFKNSLKLSIGLMIFVGPFVRLQSLYAKKISAKLSKLKLPSYVRPELHYEVAFKLNPPKFPPLPSADFGVALSPPFPDWFVCGNVLKDLQNSSKKRAERVVPTKHTLDTFKGHLHIDLEHVHVLTPIPEGLDSDNLFD